MLWALALACAPPWTTCRDGWALASDGHCWPLEADSFEAALDDLAPCAPASPDGRLDLDGGCVDGACAYAPYEAFESALGPADSCAAAWWDAAWMYCWWTGLDGLFPDTDLDGLPDPGAPGDRVEVFAPYDGTSRLGAGIGEEVACLLDELGEPETVTLEDVAGVLEPRDLWWPASGVWAYDTTDSGGGSHPDGLVDVLVLTGPPG